MPVFMPLKNTLLLVLFLILSCRSKTSEKIEKKVIETKTTPIVIGASRLQTYLPLLKEKNVGIVANQTSVIFKETNNQYTHLVDTLTTAGITIKKVFSPEHGFRGKADAGEKVKDGFDIKTGLPIISLYGKNKKPTPAQLENIDVVLFDIQDVGVRFYTYISTLHLIMEACAENKIPVVVLDRPNPNGSYIDGPTMEPQHRSFLGMHTIPLVHGMTIGEYARMINGEKWLENETQCDLTIIELKNYHRKLVYHLPIKPSPNLPNDTSINLYPSLGLFEGTNINAGRGTDNQFQMYGAPFLNSNSYAFSYTPKANDGAKYPKHQNTLCYGVDLRDHEKTTQVHLKWLINAYNNTKDKSLFFKTASFTKHAGTEKLQEQIEQGIDEDIIKESWQKDIKSFKKIRKKYLLYK